jgi:hypothetical protein
MAAPRKLPAIFTLILLALACVFAIGFIGAVTNMVNGSLSPLYYCYTLRWHSGDIWRMAVAQGAAEGLQYGALFAAGFMGFWGIFVPSNRHLHLAWKTLFQLCLFVLGCWMLGGAIGLLLAWWSPAIFQNRCPFLLNDPATLYGFSWVAGSVKGAVYGGLISLGLVCPVLKQYPRQS